MQVCVSPIQVFSRSGQVRVAHEVLFPIRDFPAMSYVSNKIYLRNEGGMRQEVFFEAGISPNQVSSR